MTLQRWQAPNSDLAQLGLSPRLAEVLYGLCQGPSNKHIASRMEISEGAVRRNDISELLRLFNVKRRRDLMIEISRLGIRIPPPEGHALTCRVRASVVAFSDEYVAMRVAFSLQRTATLGNRKVDQANQPLPAVAAMQLLQGRMDG